MANEKKWAAIAPRLLTANGGSLGQTQIADTRGIKVKQQVVLTAPSLPDLLLEVKKVLSRTTIILGKIGQPITQSSDLTAYTTILSSFIYAEEQIKRIPVSDERENALYEQEPTVARRTHLVDYLGQSIDSSTDKSGNTRFLVDSLNGMVPPEYDDTQLTYNLSDDLIDVKFYLSSVLITELSLTYDINDNLTRVQRIV